MKPGYRYVLEQYTGPHSRHKCPNCDRTHQFTLYIDVYTGKPLADHVGRCNRENGCSYHFTPREYFAATNGKAPSYKFKKDDIRFSSEKSTPIDFLPEDILIKTTSSIHYKKNNFYLFLASLFTDSITASLFSKYRIGTSKYWKGAAVFPQIDTEEKLRQIKIMLYNQHTGKRVKQGERVERLDTKSNKYVNEITQEPCILFYGKKLTAKKNSNIQQTFFGCHLLKKFPDKPVCLVESEKTALIASVYFSDFLWLATGGANGCKWQEYSVYKALQGRSVTFFPDFGFFNRKTGKTCYQEWTERCMRIAEALPGTQIRVSDVLEKLLAHLEREDQDLVDIILNKDEQTGLALTEAGYPVIFDYR